MRATTLEQFRQDPETVPNASQREQALVTDNGHPVAIVVGLQLKDVDVEDARLETSAEFRQMIEERRKEPTVPLRDIEEQLFDDEPVASATTDR